jgi:hypothetical protein
MICLVICYTQAGSLSLATSEAQIASPFLLLEDRGSVAYNFYFTFDKARLKLVIVKYIYKPFYIYITILVTVLRVLDW